MLARGGACVGVILNFLPGPTDSKNNKKSGEKERGNCISFSLLSLSVRSQLNNRNERTLLMCSILFDDGRGRT